MNWFAQQYIRQNYKAPRLSEIRFLSATQTAQGGGSGSISNTNTDLQVTVKEGQRQIYISHVQLSVTGRGTVSLNDYRGQTFYAGTCGENAAWSERIDVGMFIDGKTARIQYTWSLQYAGSFSLIAAAAVTMYYYLVHENAKDDC